MNPFNQAHYEIIEELVKSTLHKAASSMEMMLKIRIRAEHIKYAVGPTKPVAEWDQLGEFTVHIAKFAFTGDINGAFYFIINRPEIDLINRIGMPGELMPDNRPMSKVMQHGFMSEIENIIASNSLTEISNFLGVHMQGEVPEILIMQGKDINDYLLDENDILPTAFHVKSVLAGVAIEVAPHFIWMLDQKFNDILRQNVVS
jgi:chemotaxis protein CheY-P-specific phosphatase CheC